MLIPIVCYECGKTLADKLNDFIKLLREKYGNEIYTISSEELYSSNIDICEKIGVKKMCCRMHLISSVNIIDQM